MLVEEFQCDPHIKAKISPLMPMGVSVLYLSVIRGHANLVEYLVADIGMDVNSMSNGHTLLHAAASSGNVEVVKILLRHKCDTKIRDMGGRTPLEVAIDTNHEDCVQALLETLE
jgi:ankyrin repeat protein